MNLTFGLNYESESNEDEEEERTFGHIVIKWQRKFIALFIAIFGIVIDVAHQLMMKVPMTEKLL